MVYSFSILFQSFEDFEFRLLEEEALLLSKRDEYQGELSKISNDLEHTRAKISNLYSQKEQLLQNASDEIKSLELQVRCHTRTLQQVSVDRRIGWKTNSTASPPSTL